MAPNVGSSPRRIHRRISGYVPADGTQVTEPQASKMWNYFLPGPLVPLRKFCVADQKIELKLTARKKMPVFGYEPTKWPWPHQSTYTTTYWLL